MPAGSDRPRYYWDTCCFIHLLDIQNRERSSRDDQMQQAVFFLEQAFREAAEGRVKLVTAELLLAEILPVDEEHENFLKQLKACPHIELVTVSRQVFELAGHLRAEWRTNQQKDLKAPDAIHIATALLFKPDEMWTTDSRILKLCQPNEGTYRGLRIVRPHPLPQMRLPEM
ncbi:MAG: type II toxin-antitoxin system VapC family toxin [Armatimonadota bacterium]|nr:type II toxin-antitoxin system VapC family toxin [Armatimonadota bacterium]